MNWNTYYLDPSLNSYAKEKMVEQYHREEKERELTNIRPEGKCKLQSGKSSMRSDCPNRR
jgi:hypothetical protein